MLNFKHFSKKYYSTLKNSLMVNDKTTSLGKKFAPKFILKFSKFYFLTRNLVRQENPLKTGSQLVRKTNSFSFSTSQEEYLEEFKKYEKVIQEAQEISSRLLKSLKSQTINEEIMITEMKNMNQLPMRFSDFEEIKDFIMNNLERIPLTKTESIVQFIQFVDKLDIDNLEQHFIKFDAKIRKFIDKFNIKEISVLVYAYSKYQILDKNVWKSFYKILNGKISELKLESITQIFLAFTMAKSLSSNKESDLLSEEEYKNLFNEIIKEVDSKISDLTYLDTFRICISMTKRPVPITNLSENVWINLQNNFKKDITTFDLYQMSQIILLFCETPYLDSSIFSAVEHEISNEYLSKLDDMQKMTNFNIQSFLEDISKISFSFSLARQGSQYFWSQIVKTFIKLKGNISNLSTENLLFTSYRLIDYLTQTMNINQSDEIIKNLFSLFQFLEEKIIIERLLEENKIDSFNTMMPFARFGNTNEKIWNPLVSNIFNFISKTKQINPFLLNDLIFGLSNYYMNLTILKDSHAQRDNSNLNEDFSKIYYLQNFKKIWDKIEEFIINTDEKLLSIPHIANMIIDLSQIDLELTKAWSFLSENVLSRLDEFDVNNFVMILMGFSKRDISNKQLWIKLEQFVTIHINQFSIEDMRKIVVSFLKHRELNREFWKIIENKFTQNEIIQQLTLEYMIDLQISFAITNIINDKIWNKFEEIVFKNLKLFESDKDYLMNTLYSFSRIGKGSPVFWNKFASVISRDINNYDIDDLGHIIVCLKSEYIENKKIGNIINENFWNSFASNIEEKLMAAKLNSLNNLIRGVKDNEYLKKKEKLVKKIENRITELLKNIPK